MSTGALQMTALVLLLVVPGISLLVQYSLRVHLHAKVLRKLCSTREPGRLEVREGWENAAQGFWRGLPKPRKTFDFERDDSDTGLGVDDRGFKFDGQRLEAVCWAEERKHWEKEAESIRRCFLARSQENAERWRTVFVGALGLFTVVLLVNKPSAAELANPTAVLILIVFALVLSLNAVAFTGWASAGMPKIMVDLDARSAFIEEIRHGTGAVARLRIGIASGVLAVAALVLALASAFDI